jgi:hypothetical protein
MYRIVYNKNNGNIAMCKHMTDAQWEFYSRSKDHVDFLEGSISTRDIRDFWVDPVTKLLGPKPARPINILEYIRLQRIAALAETDWTQLPDSPLSEELRAAYAAYRQAWRDLPENSTTINNIEDIQWPIKP